MKGIDKLYWQKCISHMLKEVDYYLVLDGITAPLDNEVDMRDVNHEKNFEVDNESNSVISNCSLESKVFLKVLLSSIRA